MHLLQSHWFWQWYRHLPHRVPVVLCCVARWMEIGYCLKLRWWFRRVVLTVSAGLLPSWLSVTSAAWKVSSSSDYLPQCFNDNFFLLSLLKCDERDYLAKCNRPPLRSSPALKDLKIFKCFSSFTDVKQWTGNEQKSLVRQVILALAQSRLSNFCAPWLTLCSILSTTVVGWSRHQLHAKPDQGKGGRWPEGDALDSKRTQARREQQAERKNRGQSFSSRVISSDWVFSSLEVFDCHRGSLFAHSPSVSLSSAPHLLKWCFETWTSP